MVSKSQLLSRRSYLKSILEKKVHVMFHLENRTVNLKGILRYDSCCAGYFLEGKNFEVQIPLKCVQTAHSERWKTGARLYVNLNKMYNVQIKPEKYREVA